MMVILSFAMVFAIEVFLHWALARNVSPQLLAMYLSNSKLNSITMLIDNFLPSAFLGLVSGWVGYQWTTWRLNFFAVLLAFGVFGTHFIYRTFFPSAFLWWWPPELGEGLVWFGTGIVFALFFSHLGRNFRRYREDHAR
jgi:hypothetical protein